MTKGNKKKQTAPPASGGIFTDAVISVDELAEWLSLTPRRVQQLEKKGITVKDAHGEWLLRVSVQNYVRELNTKAEGKNTKYHQERTKLMEIKRKDAERAFLEAMNKLVNDITYQRAREEKDAKIKQRLLSFEKSLPQKTGGLPAEAQVPIIRNEIRKILIELAAPERPVGNNHGGGPDIPAAAGANGVGVGGPEPQAQQ